MDFALTDDQKAVAELATKIYAGKPADPWRELAGAGLFGICAGEDVGGAGQGVLEWCAMLAAAGAAAGSPSLWAVSAAAMAIDRWGGDRRKAILPALIRGEAVATLALEADGVLAAERARWFVAPRADGVYLVEATDARVERQVLTTGEAAGRVELGAGVRIADDPSWLVERATVGLCAFELGICEQVLRMTAQYTAQRVQFDRPIATFQAVAQRAADAFIDVESIRLTMWEAAWRLASGLPAAREVAIAKYFASDAGQRVTYAAQHLHGGIGFDLDYPLAKYYPLSKLVELTLGGASAQLAKLGALL
jgi:alkylation response protein AidB-like acyl-CoA dehydrogenase